MFMFLDRELPLAIILVTFGRLTQRESAAFTRQKSLVQIQYRPPGIKKAADQAAFFIPGDVTNCWKNSLKRKSLSGIRTGIILKVESPIR
jgi:hypothetical protein